MSAFKTLQLTCDRCGTVAHFTEEGWDRQDLNGWSKLQNEDLCPTCTKSFRAWRNGILLPDHDPNYEAEDEDEIQEEEPAARVTSKTPEDLTAHEVRVIASLAAVDERSVRRMLLTDKRMASTTKSCITTALRRLGRTDLIPTKRTEAQDAARRLER